MRSGSIGKFAWLAGLGWVLAGCVTYSTEDKTAGPVLGRACEDGSDCGPEADCFVDPPGGYCLMPEPNDCFYDTECPTDTVCAPRTLSQRAGLCLRVCADGGDCRPGYVCAQVELFPGDPTGPKSSSKVCWLPCYPGADQLCNDDPLISSLRGTCMPNFTCYCSQGELNPASGRCL